MGGCVQRRTYINPGGAQPPGTCHLNPMGSSHSYVTDPNAFATGVEENVDEGRWKAYDYVVVGGGLLHFGSRYFNNR